MQQSDLPLLRNQPRHTAPGVRTRLLALALAALLLCAVPAMAQLSLTGQVIAGGGGHSESPGGCLVLDGTAGQAIAGSANGGAFALGSGYWAGAGSDAQDRIFHQGFEGCQ
jgi:hypothetical protein